MNRNFVYISNSVYGTTNVVNYDSNNNGVNNFIKLFDVWNSSGEVKVSEDGVHKEVWFECSKFFYDMCKSGDMCGAFNRLGVKVVFDYPF